MREMFGMVLGWLIVTVTAWFAALALMGYGLANINPLTWTTYERVMHLCIQGLIIAAYAYYTRPTRLAP